MKPQPYPSDLTDAQWAILEPLLPKLKPLGRPRKNGLRRVVDAILYRNRGGAEGDIPIARRNLGELGKETSYLNRRD